MIVDLLPTDEQQMIVESISTLLNRQLPMSRFADRKSWAAGAEIAAWNDFVEFGLFEFGCSDPDDGGYGAAEEVLAVRSLGRRCVSLTVVATMLATRAAHEEQSVKLADALRTGATRAAFANPLGNGEYHLIDASDCDWLLVLDQPVQIIARSAVTEVIEFNAHDETVQAERVRFTRSATDIQSDITHHVSLLLSAYLTGIAQATVDMASEYAKVRVQFGQPIGGFQAIKHSCADMVVRAAAAEAQTFYSAVIGKEGRPPKGETACARLLSRNAATENAKSNIQIHGAMGFTAESEAHLFLKRALFVGTLGSHFRTEQIRIMADAVTDNRSGPLP